jgi:glycerophosphoryl diester phosphodiesterase
MLVIAHRGASAAFPENTLAAFSGAIVQEVDGVELDVRRTADQRLAVAHDDVLAQDQSPPLVVPGVRTGNVQHAAVLHVAARADADVIDVSGSTANGRSKRRRRADGTDHEAAGRHTFLPRTAAFGMPGIARPCKTRN